MGEEPGYKTKNMHTKISSGENGYKVLSFMCFSLSRRLIEECTHVWLPVLEGTPLPQSLWRLTVSQTEQLISNTVPFVPMFGQN